MKVWEENYNNNTIRVENQWHSERLYVNGILQDEQLGLAGRSRLWGKLPTGEIVKVSLGGVLTIQCRMFIDDTIISSK